MVTVLTGSNDYLRQAELAARIAEFTDKYGEINIERIDAAEIELGRLLESVSSMPFLAERRMIILTNVGMNKDLSAGIDQVLDSVTEVTDLIIDEQKFDKRSSLHKTLKKRTDFKEFTDLDDRKLAAWLSQEAKSRGGELSQSDANYIINLAGTNQLGLSHELDKLLSYDSKIDRKTIDLLVEPLPSSTVFHLLDAAFSGKRSETLRIYKDQRKQQVEPQAIMGMIAWQIHIIAVVKSNETLSVDALASQAKLNPFVVRKTMQLTRNMPLAKVRGLVSNAAELDGRLKSEAIDADDAVQHFLLTI